MKLSNLVSQVSSDPAGAVRPRDETDRRILDAAALEIAAQGFERVSIEAIAHRAGVNRATVYRRFEDRSTLVISVASREARRLAAQVAQAMLAVEDPEEQTVEGWVAAIRAAEDHPIISRMVQLEPGELIQAGREADGALMRFGVAFLTTALEVARAGGHVIPLDPRAAAETMLRIFTSFVLLPEGGTFDRSEEGLRRYAREVLVPCFLGPRA